ncbi:hypothetical protein GCM10025778_26920 [Paeniglutamicibacter antarcticus]|uniref:Amino acid permease-like protein n=1 Tax=Paeniglutamicibacter antarcticus TaxID=494023 RepID=A0ABP9TSS5_9MICC
MARGAHKATGLVWVGEFLYFVAAEESSGKFLCQPVQSFLADAAEPARALDRSLTTWDPMIMGGAVAVGAGSFSVGARAAANFSGPTVTLPFVMAALTCAMAIMCHAGFATAIPVAGSPYVFSQARMGELGAWIIGWNLIFELFTAVAVIAKYWGYLPHRILPARGSTPFTHY